MKIPSGISVIPPKRCASYIYPNTQILFYFYFRLTLSIPSAKSSLQHMPAPVTLTWGWEASTAGSQTYRVVLTWNGGSAGWKSCSESPWLLLIHFASSAARGESQMSDYCTSMTSPDFVAWPAVWSEITVSLENPFSMGDVCYCWSPPLSSCLQALFVLPFPGPIHFHGIDCQVCTPWSGHRWFCHLPTSMGGCW